MELRISFYTLIVYLSLANFEVVHAAEFKDPCPSNQDNIASDICTDDLMEKRSDDGSKLDDSILLRITKQQNNCKCHVSLQTSASNVTINMSKQEGTSNSTHERLHCGLAVDVEHVDTTDTIRSLQLYECSSGPGVRAISAGSLTLKSRILYSDYPRGYYRTIYTCKMNDQVEKGGSDADWVDTNGKQHTSLDECRTYCLVNKDCVSVYYQQNYCFVYNKTTTVYYRTNATYSQKHCVDTQKLKIKCYPPWPDTSTLTSQETIIEDTVGNSQGSNLNTIPTIETEEENIKDDDNASLPVIFVAVVGWCFTAFFAITTFCLYRRTCTAPSNISREQNAINQYEDLSASRLSSNYNSLNR